MLIKSALLLHLIQLPASTPVSNFFFTVLLLIPVINFFVSHLSLYKWIFYFLISSFHFLTRVAFCPVKALHANEIMAIYISNWLSLNNWRFLLTLPTSKPCSLSIMLTISLSFG